MTPQRKRYSAGDDATPTPPREASKPKERPRSDALEASSGGFPWGMLALGLIVGAAAVYFFRERLPWLPREETLTTADAITIVHVEPEIPRQSPSAPSAERPTQRRSQPTPRSPVQAAPEGQPSEPVRSENEIRAKLRSSHAGFSQCYQAGLADDPTIEGMARVRFRIEAAGRVTNARVIQTTLNSKKTEECALSIIRAWRFGQASGAEEFEFDLPEFTQ